ncbi:hypothetical protein GH714_039208 [Hevea brasiliensis]|uniref:Pectinesterase inhibitor domain-containing protein n=1 Tax=Hevea brasiliensis TaxID=3981 RepID=A0A6A6MU09_HEVBR|nr:hypothetical protein GH714_039208 [Hevea brasiliensis]
MRPAIIFIIFLFLSWVTSSKGWGSNSRDSYVRDACSVTKYQDLCVHSLSSFSRTAGRSPGKWARAGVSVTIGEAKSVTQYLNKLNKYGLMRGGRNRIAFSDCIENFQDTIDNLHKSLGVLKNLDATNFDTQMGDKLLDRIMEVVERGLKRQEELLLQKLEKYEKSFQEKIDKVVEAIQVVKENVAVFNNDDPPLENSSEEQDFFDETSNKKDKCIEMEQDQDFCF